MTPRRALTGISLIAVNVKVVSTRGRSDSLVCLNSINPSCPSTSRLRHWPVTIGSQDTFQTDNPRRELHVHKGDMGTEEERARRIGSVNDCADLGPQLPSLLNLLFSPLSLQ